MRTPLVENYPVANTFAVGAEVDDASEFVRITFWDDNSQEEHVIVTRIVMPLGAFHRMVKEMLGAQRELS